MSFPRLLSVPRRLFRVAHGQASTLVRGTPATALVLLALCSCLPTTAPRVDIWRWDSATGGAPPIAAAIYASLPRAEPVELSAAINETVSFTFALRAGEDGLDDLSLRPTILESAEGTMPADAMSLFRLLPVRAGPLPGWSIRTVPPHERVAEPLDVLVPLHAPRGGLPPRLAPGQVYRLWCDLRIDKGTAPGRYGGEIEVRSGDRVAARLPLRIEVLPFLLPDENRIPFIVEVDHRALVRHHIRTDGRPLILDQDDWHGLPQADAIDRLILDTMRLLRDHRLDPVLPRLAPLVRMDATGEAQADWTLYDRIAAPLLSGEAFTSRVPLAAWPLPLDNFLPPPAADGTVPIDEVEPAVARVGRTITRHFEDMGWLSRSYALVPTGAYPESAAAFGILRTFSRAVRQAHDEAQVASLIAPQNMAPLGWPNYPWSDISSVADIWLPRAQFYDMAALQELRRAGRQAWLTVDRPPFSGTLSIHGQPADVLVLPWQADYLHAAAIFAETINAWPAADAALEPSACLAADDRCLLYPGSFFGLDRPVESVRLRLLRRAMQDAARLDMLDRHQLDYVAEPLRRAIVAYAGSEAYRTHFADGRPPGWPADAARFDGARRIMAGALAEKVMQERGDDQGEPFARDAAWRRFMLTTRRFQATVEGVRVRKTGPRSTDLYRVECSVVLHNHQRTPIAGTLRFAQPPAGWTTAPRTVAPIPPGGARRVVLEADAANIPADASGSLSLPIEFSTGDGETHTLNARLSYAISVRGGSGIAIDGDLSEWPVGVVNVLADFVLITGVDEGDASLGRPARATTAFVLRDERYLYVAVNCASAPPTGGEPRRKTVTYDDLVPTGEELVELLIDPLSSGTRSPTDLYHIVIKRSGADLAEMGIEFRPPCGVRAAWAVDLEAATHAGPNRWVAELRIPLDAFGDRAKSMPIWGLNITRFDADAQEFSTWSGAVGNAYDPLSLGNLYMP